MRDQHPALDELLLAEAHELPTSRSLSIEWHVANCATCQDALSVHRATLAKVADEQVAESVPGDAVAVARVRGRLVEQLNRPETRPSGWAWLGVAAAIFAVVTLVDLWPGGRPGANTLPAGTLPLPHLTPGATVHVSAEDICSGRLAAPPVIGEQVRDEVVRNYRVAHLPSEHYELDYLITPELGGATVAANLWPEPYEGLRWNARVKDHLERLLPRMVCKGDVDLATAQQDIARDWVAAYRKYFGTAEPLQDYAGLPTAVQPFFETTGARYARSISTHSASVRSAVLIVTSGFGGGS